MPPGFTLEAPGLFTSACYFSAGEAVRADIGLHTGCSHHACIFFFLHQMLTSGNSPTPEKSLVLHQVILEFHKRSAFQNTFLGCFCRKGMTRRGNLLLTGVFKDSANAN